MKWETYTQEVPEGEHRARCGHLYARVEAILAGESTVEQIEADRDQDPDRSDHESPDCVWFVEPDDEDKSYRRALATGRASDVDAAKEAAQAACARLAQEMLASLAKAVDAGGGRIDRGPDVNGAYAGVVDDRLRRRLAQVVHILEHGDDLQPDPALSRLQLDLVIEDARVVNDGGRPTMAAGVVQLADRVAHLEHVIAMIGRAARGDP